MKIPKIWEEVKDRFVFNIIISTIAFSTMFVMSELLVVQSIW